MRTRINYALLLRVVLRQSITADNTIRNVHVELPLGSFPRELGWKCQKLKSGLLLEQHGTCNELAMLLLLFAGVQTPGQPCERHQ